MVYSCEICILNLFFLLQFLLIVYEGDVPGFAEEASGYSADASSSSADAPRSHFDMSTLHDGISTEREREPFTPHSEVLLLTKWTFWVYMMIKVHGI